MKHGREAPGKEMQGWEHDVVTSRPKTELETVHNITSRESIRGTILPERGPYVRLNVLCSTEL